MEIVNEHGTQDSKRIITGILGIIFGSLGFHKFVLGYRKEGFIMLAITVCTFFIASGFVGLIGLIEGIIYLTKSDEEFIQTYQLEKKGWF